MEGSSSARVHFPLYPSESNFGHWTKSVAFYTILSPQVLHLMHYFPPLRVWIPMPLVHQDVWIRVISLGAVIQIDVYCFWAPSFRIVHWQGSGDIQYRPSNDIMNCHLHTFRYSLVTNRYRRSYRSFSRLNRKHLHEIKLATDMMFWVWWNF